MKKFIFGAVIAIAVVLGSSNASAYTFSNYLSVGSTGADVTALQQMLVAQGHLVMPAGTSYGYFGQLTKTAVMKYQAMMGLPSTGFVGPLTVAKLNAGGAMTGGTSGSTSVACPVGFTCTATSGGSSTSDSTSASGEEGELTDIDTSGGVESTVDEGEEEVVLAVEVDAEDSEMNIERVDVDFTIGSGGSSNLDDYIESVSLYIDGKEVASDDVDEADEDNDVFSFRFTGLKSVVEEDETATIEVMVKAVNNLDTEDEGIDITVEIPVNGIRAVDGAGISETYVDSGDNLIETFSVDTATDGELDITEANESPESGIITVDDENDTNDVTLLIIELESDEQDLEITDLPVGFVASGAGAGEIIKTAKLMMGSKTLDSVSISSTSATHREALFEDIDLEIEEGDTVTLKVVVDVNDLDGGFTAGDSLYATVTGTDSNWDVEDSEGQDITPEGSVTGETLSFYEDGIEVSLVNTKVTNVVTADPATSGSADQKSFEITFSVEAIGEDVYIDKSNVLSSSPSTAGAGTAWATTTDSTSSSTGAGVVIVSASGDTDEDTANVYKVDQGDKRNFTIKVTLTATADGYTGVRLTGVNWTTDSADTTPNDYYTFDLEDFKIDPVFMNII